MLGTTSGDVDVYVNNGGEYISPQHLDAGTEYLFIVRMESMPGYRRLLSTGIGCAMPAIEWTAVDAANRTYVEGLSSGKRDGRIFGNVLQSQGGTFPPFAATRVHLRDRSGVSRGVATTDRDGHFELSGLAAGQYRVTTDLSPCEFKLVEGVNDTVSLVPHGCDDASLVFTRRDD